MTGAWITVGALFVITAGLRAVGPVTVGGRSMPGWAGGVIALVAPAVLAGLIVYEAVGDPGGGVAPDERLAGIAAAGAAVAARAPLLVVVAVAPAVTAGVRLVS
ncbi:MAG: AzlD domain-containing protein [Solirubrobacterales bacterium]